MDEPAATVSDGDRERMRRQAAALAAHETDDEGSLEWRAAMVEAIDRRRDARGIAPLQPWWASKGELELHERARALGLLRPLR